MGSEMCNKRQGAGAAGAGRVGATTTFWFGLGRTLAVGRMAIASDTTRATTPMTKIAATALPTSLNELRSA
ncbi:hypothetical protein PICSAR70_04559 [Mycobacterium avium subsp. paratuberculosis]|nr:hypothetical protein PICSAR70_04559 [Mycobacterium avium subsp. paratuberculosis]